MVTRVHLCWKQIKTHPVITLLIPFLVALFLTITIGGYGLNWTWTGFTGDKETYKTLYDWMQLLIIPAVLAVAGYILNLTISRGERDATNQRAQSDREAAEKRAETERKIEEDKLCETAFKEYIDRMSELILHEDLLGSEPKKEVREIARIQTLTVLNRLDGKRKGRVLQFLNDSKLINKDKAIIDLKGANLSGANLCEAHLNGAGLRHVDLSGADLSGAFLGLYPWNWEENEDNEDALKLAESDLRYAILNGANLSEAYLADTNLNYAQLRGANLSKAYLSYAYLNGADLTRANLSHAILSYAELRYANLTEANLSQADPQSADFTCANLTKADLSNTWFDGNTNVHCVNYGKPDLKGTTMPDGSKHP